MKETKQLIEVNSMHEQREFSGEFGPYPTPLKEGHWIEVLNFEPMTEQTEIMRRWEVNKIDKINEGNVVIYTITCKELNTLADDLNKGFVAEKVLEKHGDKLKASFAKCLVDGIECRPIEELKNMLEKMGVDLNEYK